MSLKVGDLVKLHPEESVLMPQRSKHLPGLVVAIDDSTMPRTIVVLWNGNREPEEEYEDGLILIERK